MRLNVLLFMCLCRPILVTYEYTPSPPFQIRVGRPRTRPLVTFLQNVFLEGMAGGGVANTGVCAGSFPCAAPARKLEFDSTPKKMDFRSNPDLVFDSGCYQSPPIAPFRSRTSESFLFKSIPFEIRTPNVFDPGRSQTCFFLCAHAAPILVTYEYTPSPPFPIRVVRPAVLQGFCANLLNSSTVHFAFNSPTIRIFRFNLVQIFRRGFDGVSAGVRKGFGKVSVGFR